MQNSASAKVKLIKTGSRQFDDILGGGLPANRVYLLHGEPGSGKTTLSLQFLLEGAQNNETVLYITLSETKDELTAVAESHGMDISGIDIFEMIAGEAELDPENQSTVFQPSDTELNVTIKAMLKQIEKVRPSRVVIDSLSEVKLLAQTPLRFRRQVLGLKQFFAGRSCTTLFLDDQSSTGEDSLQLESIAHGVINLEQLSPEYGAERRRLRITKLRGAQYRGGFHDFSIVRGGLSVFPRIVASEHIETAERAVVKSGIEEMDALLCGGLDAGSSTLLLGPAGVGKSTLSIQYAVQAAKNGDRSIIFAFDERVETLMMRAAGLKIELKKYVDEKMIEIRSVDPAELSPGEFAHSVRLSVEGTKDRAGVKIVVIDSLNGYLNAMPEERFLNAQLHELLTYLGHRGVSTFLVVAQHGLLGNAMRSVIDTSYLADTVILFRYFEAAGAVRQIISVLKKRTGKHERTIREYSLNSDRGIEIGKPLDEFHGVLTGTPTVQGLADEHTV
jgi:circadian clock protein KaiC